MNLFKKLAVFALACVALMLGCGCGETKKSDQEDYREMRSRIPTYDPTKKLEKGSYERVQTFILYNSESYQSLLDWVSKSSIEIIDVQATLDSRQPSLVLFTYRMTDKPAIDKVAFISALWRSEPNEAEFAINTWLEQAPANTRVLRRVYVTKGVFLFYRND